jgi:hypothetical protein
MGTLIIAPIAGVLALLFAFYKASVVAFSNFPSKLLPLFLPQIDSAPPAISPEIPADFPDCSKMLPIKTKLAIIKSILNTSSTITPPALCLHNIKNYNTKELLNQLNF